MESTSLATGSQIQEAINNSVSDALLSVYKYKGAADTLPTVAMVGDVYTVTTAIAVVPTDRGNEKAEVGDTLLVAEIDTDGVPTKYVINEKNLDGAVTSLRTNGTDNSIALFDGATGQIIKDSGKTIATGELGQTGGSDNFIPTSKTVKEYVDTQIIENAYVLDVATKTELGGVKIGIDTEITNGVGVGLNNDLQMSIPTKNTTTNTNGVITNMAFNGGVTGEVTFVNGAATLSITAIDCGDL